MKQSILNFDNFFFFRSTEEIIILASHKRRFSKTSEPQKVDFDKFHRQDNNNNNNKHVGFNFIKGFEVLGRKVMTKYIL